MKKINLLLIAIFFCQVLDGQELKMARPKNDISPAPAGNDYVGYRPHPNPLQTEFLVRPDFAPLRKTTFDAVYDLRNTSYLTSVKNQGGCGACWTFSTFGAFESHLKKTGAGTFDLSEQNLKNRHNFEAGHCSGGDYYMSTCYFVRGDGPALESEDPYNTSTSSSTYYTPQFYLGEARYLPKDANIIKQAILDHGALATTMYWDDVAYDAATYTYYDNSGNPENHGVTLVGWDDNKVVPGAPGNGAWIIKNSWGAGWGESGYFYISYHDQTINNSVAFWPEHYAYGENYFAEGYDDVGYIGDAGYELETAFGLMRYTPTRDNEKLLKVGTWAVSTNAEISVNIYDDFDGTTLSTLLAGISAQSTTYAGFYSFDLPDTLSLTKNDDVFIEVEYTTPGYGYPVPIEFYYAGYSNPTLESDRYYITYEGGAWDPLGDDGYDLCIKVYGYNHKENSLPVFTDVMSDQGVTENHEITFDYNATDDDGDDLAYSLKSSSPGMTINSTTGLFSWTPDFTQAGQHDVVVNVFDGEATVSSTTTQLTVLNNNRNPVFTQTLPDTQFVEQTTLAFYYVAEDPDTDDNLAYSLPLKSTGMSINTSTGLFTWTPDNSQIGTHNVRAAINDGTTTIYSKTSEIVVLRDNHTPTFTQVMPDTQINENEILNYTFQADDEDGDDLSFSLKNYSAGMQINATTGEFTWQPTFTQSGNHSLQARVTDGTATTDSRSISITVDNVNRPPRFTDTMPDRNLMEFDSLTYQYTAGDDDGDDLTFALNEAVSGASITSDGLFKFISPRVFSDTVFQIIVHVSDLADITADTALIQVENINEPPVFTTVMPDTQIVEDEILQYDFAASDIEDDDLTFTLKDSSNGMSIGPVSGAFSWQPGFHQAGNHLLKVHVSDGINTVETRTISIDVENVNRPPFFTSVLPDTEVVETDDLSFVFVAEDADGDDLAFTLVDSSAGMSINPATGRFDWAPTYYQSGDHTLSVSVSDGTENISTGPITITVNNLNQAPVFTAVLPDTTIFEYDTLEFSYQGEDFDGDAIRFAFSNNVPNASITTNGSFTYRGPQIFSDTTITVAVILTDDKDSTATTAVISIVNIDEPPVFTATLPDTQIAELQYLEYLFRAHDPDDTEFEFNLTDSSRGMIIDPQSGLFSWTPTYYQSGDHTLKVNVTDGSSIVESPLITIRVDNVNQLPQFTAILPDTHISELEEFSFQFEAADADGNDLSFALADSSAGMLVDTLTGLFAWTPAYDQAGQHGLKISVNDGEDTVYTPTILIDVVNTNQLPFFTAVMPDTAVDETEPLHFTFQADDGDENVLAFSLLDSSTGMVIGASSGEFSWVPTYHQSGDHILRVDLSDGLDNVSSDTIHINVRNLNRMPAFTTVLPDTFIISGNEFEYQYEGMDPDEEKISFDLVSDIKHASIDSAGYFHWFTEEVTTDTLYEIIVSLSDSSSAVYDTAEVLLKDKNYPPVFIAELPDTMINERDTLDFGYQAVDPDGDSLRFGLAQYSVGMAIDSLSGRFFWVPTFDQAGGHSVQVTVSDGYFTVNSIIANIFVDNVNRPPYFTKTLPDTTVTKGDTLDFTYEAADPDNDGLDYGLEAGPANAAMTSTGIFSMFLNHYTETTTETIIVKVHDGFINIFDTTEVVIEIPVSVDGIAAGIPEDYILHQNYPNPFNPSTVVRYGLPKKSKVVITIFDITGKTVEVIENSIKDAGYHKVTWQSHIVPSGIYFYRLQADNFVTVKKCLYMK